MIREQRNNKKSIYFMLKWFDMKFIRSKKPVHCKKKFELKCFWFWLQLLFQIVRFSTKYTYHMCMFKSLILLNFEIFK